MKERGERGRKHVVVGDYIAHCTKVILAFD